MARTRHPRIDVTRKGHVVTFTLRLGGGRLDESAHAALAAACAEVDLDDEVRAVVVRGSGRTFCVGDAHDVRVESVDGIDAVGRLRVPTVAVVGGDAIDAGLELALACDLRVASSDARLGLTQATSGQVPFHGGTQRLPRVVGGARAAKMLLLGETWTAKEAQRAGLVQSVVARADVSKEVRALTRQLAARAPVAQRLAKETLRAAADLPLAEGLRLEGDLYVLLHTTRDRDEGIASFHEKRRPTFEGR